MAVINRSHEWDVEDINYNVNQIEDDKTLKELMFTMIQELSLIHI